MDSEHRNVFALFFECVAEGFVEGVLSATLVFFFFVKGRLP